MRTAGEHINRIAVLSAGNGGITFAAHFLEEGIESVTLYNRSPNRLKPIQANGNCIFARGEICGPEGKILQLDLVTTDPVEAIQGADFIVMAGTQPAIDHLGRALVPQEVDGLLVTGRAASIERDIMGALRLIPPCTVLGEAAGAAAAVAADTGVAPRAVDIERVKKVLREHGVEFRD